MPTNNFAAENEPPYPPISTTNPIIEGDEGSNHLLGTASGDIMIGHAGNDTLAGGNGFDIMTGGAGNDWFHGAAGTDVAVYRGNLTDYDFQVVGGTVTKITDLREGSPDGFDQLTGTEVLVFGKQAYFASFVTGASAPTPQAARAEDAASVQVSVMASANGWLLDEQFYLEQNLDVAAAVSRGETTVKAHWEAFGQFEGRAPNALFDADYYLSTNTDLKAAFGADGKAALSHWLAYGLEEGRDASALFSSEAYLAANADVAASSFTAVEHFLLYGHAEGRASIVDTAWLGIA
ncbi:hypothetical protein [Niveispirillum sp. KHB5.9]|uniref:hypothetical protein n=1 Tax=Niveispirillum sp. KHB5.9 TaxID=3400269 RepID=UPI003A8AD87A